METVAGDHVEVVVADVVEAAEIVEVVSAEAAEIVEVVIAEAVEIVEAVVAEAAEIVEVVVAEAVEIVEVAVAEAVEIAVEAVDVDAGDQVGVEIAEAVEIAVDAAEAVGYVETVWLACSWCIQLESSQVWLEPSVDSQMGNLGPLEVGEVGVVDAMVVVPECGWQGVGELQSLENSGLGRVCEVLV